MMASILASMKLVFSLTGMLYILGGSIAGLVLGAIPGLGGGMLTIILLPLTYKMDPGLALALLMSVYIGSTSGGCIGSILLGIPGTPSSLVTCWDGYEFTKKGDPVRALSAAVVCNALGTIPGLALAMIISPVISRWAVKLGPWEYFGMCFLAIAMVIGLAKDDLAKGFLSMGIALVMCCIGKDPLTGMVRFTFGSMYLLNGIDMVNLLMGLFAARTIAMEYARDTKKKEASIMKVEKFRWPGKDIREHVGLLVRCFSIGAIIGFMPGIGMNSATALCYANERNMAKDKEMWGHGAIGGVMAPEIANNAVIGGAMTPMISLGIPGNGAMAYFITAMSIHGINAGPRLLQEQPVMVYTLYIAAMVAAVFILVSQMVGMPLFPKLLTTPYHFLYPAIMVIAFLGSFLQGNNVFYVFLALFACLLGLFMGYFKIPLMPFMMTYILGKMLESNLRRAFNYGEHGLLDFFTRPLSCALILISVGFILWNLFGDKIKAKFSKKSKLEVRDVEEGEI